MNANESKLGAQGQGTQVQEWAQNIAQGQHQETRTMNSFNYRQELAKAHAEGKVKGPLGIPGWKTASKATIQFLYDKGVCPVSVAIAKGLNYGDHCKMLEACRDEEEYQRRVIELANNGVNLSRLETVQKQREGRKNGKAVKAQEQAFKTANINAARTISIVSSSGVQEIVRAPIAKVEVPMSEQEKQVLEAVAMVDAKHAVKAAVAKIREKGYTVELTAEEKAKILANNKKREMIIR
jgi:hypothetical protein